MAANKKKSWLTYLTVVILILILVLFIIFKPKNRPESLAPENSKAGFPQNIEPVAVDKMLPALIPSDDIIHKKYYSLSYNKKYKQANWVSYKLTSQMLKNKTGRTDDFRADPEAGYYAATPEDYKRSGYHRGHLCPAGDMKFSKDAMSETFLMTNISPQDAAFDGGVWRELEEQVRDWAKKHKELYITAGPVFGKNVKTIGRNKIAVPEYFFKVILDYKEPDLKGIGFIFKNENDQEYPQFYAVSIDSVESFTGIDFFQALPDKDEEVLEKSANWRAW